MPTELRREQELMTDSRLFQPILNGGASCIRYDCSAESAWSAVNALSRLQPQRLGLQKEVVDRYEAAEQVRLAAERLVQTVRLGRGVSRAFQLGRQLEIQLGEFNAPGAPRRADHGAMVRSANTLAALKTLLSAEVFFLSKDIESRSH